MRPLSGLAEFFSALRFRDFRLFWIGLVAQVTGQQMTIVTLGWLAFHLTGSPLALGFVNLVGAAPRIAVNLAGGVLADRFDPRALITGAQAVSVSALLTLALLTATGGAAMWNLALAALALGAAQSFDEPSRASLFPRLLPDRSHIPLAAPLTSMAWSGTRIVAPSVAGFVIAASGAGLAFFLAAAGGATMIAMMRLVRPREAARSRGAMLGDLKAGAAYVWRHPVFRPLVLLAMAGSAFGQGYMLTLPVFQADVLRVDARGLGLMYSTLGVGAVCGLYVYSRHLRRRGAGRTLLGSAGAFAAGIFAFALTPWFGGALALLFFIGAAGAAQITTGQVILQTLVDDSLRGRVMALYGIHWALLPVGGAMMNGAAEAVGAPTAVAGFAAVLLAAVGTTALRGTALRSVALGTGANAAA